MSAKTLATVAIAAIMIVPALLAVSPALADNVPTIPGGTPVAWQPIPGFERTVWLHFATQQGSRNTPDCTAGQLDPTGHPVTATDDPRAPACVFSGTSAPAGGSVATSATFSAGSALVRDFNTSKAVKLHLAGSFSSSQSFAAHLRAGSIDMFDPGEVAGGTTTANALDFTLKLADGTGVAWFHAGDTVSVEITELPSSLPNLGGASPLSPTWTVDDTQSSMVIESDDAYRAATWTGDQNGTLQTTYAPLDNNSTSPPLLKGFFAIQSAWGQADVSSAPPTFRVFRGDSLYMPFPNAANTVTGVEASSLSNPSLGIKTWGFPEGSLDYRGWTAGPLRLETSFRYWSQDTLSHGNQFDFAINAHGVRLGVLADSTTVPPIFESASHAVTSGGATTFVLTANNTGGAPEAFRISTVFVPVPGSPQTGWAPTLGGPDLVGDTVSMAPLESKVFTVTIAAPFAAAGSGTFLVRATSVNDSHVVSDPLTLVASINPPAGHEVAILAPHDRSVDPGVDTDVPVYAWNRGGAPANLSLDVGNANTGAWNVGFVSGTQVLRHLVLANVPAGGLATVVMRVHGPDQSQTTQLDLDLNVTNTDATGNAFDRVTRLHLNTVAAYRVDLLDTVNGVPVTALVDPCAVPATSPAPGGGSQLPTLPGGSPSAPSANCDAQTTYSLNGLDGLLVRTWITNTGHVTENVDVKIDPNSVSHSHISNSCDSVLGGDYKPNTASFGLVTRSPTGALTQFTGQLQNVRPGDSYELYVFVAVDRTSFPCVDGSGHDFLRFNVVATGASGALAQSQAVLHADSSETLGNTAATEGTGAIAANGVILSAVSRNYTNSENNGIAKLDLSQAQQPVITKAATVGQNTTFFVRLTNGADFGTYNDSNGRLVPAWANLTIVNPRAADGWNVSVRAVNGLADAFNPGTANYTLSNDDTSTQPPPTGQAGTRRLGMEDVELRVDVSPPDGVNHTAIGGDSDQVTLFAEMGNSHTQISLISIIGNKAVVNLHGDARALAHPVDGGATAIYLYNNGSAPTTVTLSATMDPASTPNADAWSVQPATQVFDLAAFKNRTSAISIVPPQGASGGRLHVVATYVQVAPSTMATTTLDVPVDVVPSGSLSLAAPVLSTTTGPGQPAQFTLNIQNKGNGPVNYRLRASEIPNWTAILSPPQGTIAAQTTISVPFTLLAPLDAINNSTYQSIVTVEDRDAFEDFSAVPLSVSILGGSPVPSLYVPVVQKTVDRSAQQSFEVQVRNLGNAAGTLPVTVATPEAGWSAFLSQGGQAITSVSLGPNELRTVNVTVVAPLVVPENKVVSFTVTASTQDQTQQSRAILRALIHDYGVAATLPVATQDLTPGLAQDFVLHVTNTGNDNDTLNLSAILPPADFLGWAPLAISPDHVFLNPGQSMDVHATIIPPTSPLPSPRAYGFTFYVGTVGGTAVNVTKNATLAATANVLDYRALDVEGDGQQELAVDANKNKADGYESFKEISGEGGQCVVVSNSRLNGLAKFFLDCPIDGKSLDGIADVWFDPDQLYAFKIDAKQDVADVNNDGTPDYFLDTDRDTHVDMAFDTVTERYWTATEIHALGGDAVQYVVDTNADQSPDYYADPTNHVATKTLALPDHPGLVGLDTKNAGKADKYYDPATKTVTAASVSNLKDFASTNWYFLLGFLALVVIVAVLIVVRVRGRKKDEP
ncbi:MAG: hypothetical protein QOE90_1900 [Thermoplasmata archaeon]|jgi:uncharacterized membrane protein|nr:hypothetical protein [Thermoplasmata archaeon]